MAATFDEWTIQKAFTRDYYTSDVSCHFCQIPRKKPHMCVIDSGEIVKMQPCERQTCHITFYKKYKNYTCNSCFILCNPSTKLIRDTKESLKAILFYMLKNFDKNFTVDFIREVYSYIVQEDILSCVNCSMKVKGYRWRTYQKFISAYRKRRLQE